MKPDKGGLAGIFLGVLAALASSGIVLGSFLVALSEGGIRLAALPSQAWTASPSATPVTPPPTLRPGEPTYTASPVPSLTATSSATLPPTPTGCPPPSGWIPITVEHGHTLRILAETYGTTMEDLAEANCLVVSRLIPGSLLYVPEPLPVPTATALSCGPPPGWISYIVRPGDTLFGLSRIFGISVGQLQRANCLDSSNIYYGQRLYVPWLPSPVPSLTGTPTPSPTPSPSASPTLEEPSPVPSATQAATPTPVTSLPPTRTATPLPTELPTETGTPTRTPTPTPLPTDTLTPTATDPPTSTPTPTNTIPAEPSETPSPTVTPTTQLIPVSPTGTSSVGNASDGRREREKH